MKLQYYVFLIAIILSSMTHISNAFDRFKNWRNQGPTKEPTFVTDFKKWWHNQTDESQKIFYDNARRTVSDTFTPEYLQDLTNKVYTPEYIHENIVNPAYKNLKKEVSKDLGWIGGAVALGGAAIGLYRWATRRGLGGIVKDFLEKNKLNSKIEYQISQKISVLQTKKGLSKTDRLQAQSLLNIIKNRIKTDTNIIQFLESAQKNLEKIINHQSKKNEPMPVPTDQG